MSWPLMKSSCCSSTRPATAGRFFGRRKQVLWHNRRLRAERCGDPSRRSQRLASRAVSSGVEHSIHTAGVGGSKPPPPTNFLSPPSFLACRPVPTHIAASRRLPRASSHRRTVLKEKKAMATSPELPSPITSDPPDVPELPVEPDEGPAKQP